MSNSLFEDPLKKIKEKFKEIKKNPVQLSKWKTSILYKGSKDKEFNDLCEKNSDLQKEWGKILKEKGYPSDEQLECVDAKKKLPCSLFARIKGSYLLTQLSGKDLKENYPLLNEACELGMFQALNKRLKLFGEKISSSRDSKANVDKEIEILKKDADKISQLYWTLGFLHASHAYLQIADYQVFADPNRQAFQDAVNSPVWKWHENFNDTKLPEFVKSLKQAAINFYMGFLLESFPQSILMTNTLSQGRDLFESLPYHNRDEGLEELRKRIEGLGIMNSKAFLAEAFNAAHSLLREYRPEVYAIVDQQKSNHTPHK